MSDAETAATDMSTLCPVPVLGLGINWPSQVAADSDFCEATSKSKRLNANEAARCVFVIRFRWKQQFPLEVNATIDTVIT
jgi:hypothetical protein